MGGRGERAAERLRASAGPWEVVAFAWLPALVVGFAFWHELHARTRLAQFTIFRNAAKLVLDGRSPLPAPDPAEFAHFDRFVYPPASALLFVPLAELPLGVGRVAMLVLGVACVLGALRLLGVSDWRCYGVAVMSAPAIVSLAIGTITGLLLLGLALAWRYRARPGACGTAAALAVVLKVFLWPVGLWLVAVRRLRAFAVALVVGVVVTLGGWAVIGFDGLRSYPHLLRVLSDVEQGDSYSPVALLRLSGTAATVLSAVLVVLVAAGVVLAARGEDGERRSFAVAVLGALLATPVVWEYYFLLLLVPLALYRPRLSPLWLLPMLLWVSPMNHAEGHTWRIVFVLSVTAILSFGTIGERQARLLADRTRRLVPWSPRPVEPVGPVD